MPNIPGVGNVKAEGRPIQLCYTDRKSGEEIRMIRGLWESGLRLDELMHVHWSDPRYIVPKWARGSLPVLSIPAAMQKNATQELIPLLPGFEALLLESPEVERRGWAFNPASLLSK